MKSDSQPAFHQLAWRKSSYSGTNANCVEVAAAKIHLSHGRRPKTTPGHLGVAIRDSKNPEGPILLISTGDWRRFVRSFKGFV